MLARLQHQFKLAAPLFGVLSIAVFVWSWGSVLSTRQVVDGVDELTATLAGPVHALDGFATQSALWFASIALIATTVLAWQVTYRISHHHGKKRKVSPLERGAFWVGVLVVPMAYLVAPAIIGLPIVLLFGFAMIFATKSVW